MIRPLASYNSLTDPNLTGFFTNRRLRQHLRKAGLVSNLEYILYAERLTVTVCFMLMAIGNHQCCAIYIANYKCILILGVLFVFYGDYTILLLTLIVFSDSKTYATVKVGLHNIGFEITAWCAFEIIKILISSVCVI